MSMNNTTSLQTSSCKSFMIQSNQLTWQASKEQVMHSVSRADNGTTCYL